MDFHRGRSIIFPFMRQCFEIIVQGLRLRGVVHHADPQAAQSFGFEGLGVILLHPGFLPRSAQGDTAVALSDALARQGIAAVRIDMPGLGDSEGSLPADSFTFIDMVQEGGLAGVANECVDRICEQLNLQRVLIGGLCGAAITGFYAAALRKQRWISGVIALDPIFFMVRSAAPPGSGAAETTEAPDWAMRREMFTSELRLALLNSRLGGPLQKTAQKIRNLIRRSGGVGWIIGRHFIVFRPTFADWLRRCTLQQMHPTPQVSTGLSG